MVEALPWPTNARRPSQVGFAPVQPVQRSTSYWDPRTTRINPLAGYWSAFFQYNFMPHDDGVKLHAFFASLESGVFPAKVPIESYRRKVGTQGAGWAVNGTVAAGAISLPITGGTGLFAVGDYLVKEISGNPFPYVVTVAQAGGTVGIWPPFQAAATGGSLQYLGDGSSTILYCSMDIVPPLPPPMLIPGHRAGLFAPYAVEFIQSSANRFL